MKTSRGSSSSLPFGAFSFWNWEKNALPVITSSTLKRRKLSRINASSRHSHRHQVCALFHWQNTNPPRAWETWKQQSVNEWIVSSCQYRLPDPNWPKASSRRRNYPEFFRLCWAPMSCKNWFYSTARGGDSTSRRRYGQGRTSSKKAMTFSSEKSLTASLIC